MLCSYNDLIVQVDEKVLLQQADMTRPPRNTSTESEKDDVVIPMPMPAPDEGGTEIERIGGELDEDMPVAAGVDVIPDLDGIFTSTPAVIFHVDSATEFKTFGNTIGFVKAGDVIRINGRESSVITARGGMNSDEEGGSFPTTEYEIDAEILSEADAGAVIEIFSEVQLSNEIGGIAPQNDTYSIEDMYKNPLAYEVPSPFDNHEAQEQERDNITPAIINASAEIAGYLARRYSIPGTPEEAPAMLRKLCADIAIYNVFSRKGFNFTENIKDNIIVRRYDAAIEYLKMIADGEADIVDTPDDGDGGKDDEEEKLQNYGIQHIWLYRS